MGIGLTFDRALGNLEGREQLANLSEESDHGQDEVMTVPFELPANRWISFRWQLAGQHSRIWMDDPGSGRPALEQVVNDFRSESGLLGVAVWGGQVEFDGLKWTPASSDTSIDIANARVSIQQQDLPSGWSRYDGDWRRESDGSWHVSAHQGAKILWDDQPAADGDVQVEMKLSSGQAHIAGLLLNVSEPQIGADNWYGYEVSLNADNQTVFVGDHRHNFRLLKSAPAKIVPGQWHRLRAKWAQGQLLIFLDDADEPTIVLDDHDRLTGQLAGLRTWGSDVHFRNFTVTNQDVQQVAQWPAAAAQELPLRDTEQWIRKQALAALGRTLFNLNEFVYVE